MIWPIWVVDVMSRTTPERRDHFVEQPCLGGVNHNVLAQTSLQVARLLPHFLMTTLPCPDPSAPVETHEALQHWLHGLPFALFQREFGDAARDLRVDQGWG